MCLGYQLVSLPRAFATARPRLCTLRAPALALNALLLLIFLRVKPANHPASAIQTSAALLAFLGTLARTFLTSTSELLLRLELVECLLQTLIYKRFE